MKRLAASLLFVTAIFIGSTIARLGGQQPQPSGPVYTAAQAQAGQSAYEQQCAGCHGTDFRGSGDAPAVVGPDFRAKWGPERPTNCSPIWSRRCRQPIRVRLANKAR